MTYQHLKTLSDTVTRWSVTSWIKVTNSIICAHSDFEETQYEVQTVQKMKTDEKPLYEEKKKIIEELNQEISYKRKEKIDLMNSEQELQN